jgi:hypothetical protein
VFLLEFTKKSLLFYKFVVDIVSNIAVPRGAEPLGSFDSIIILAILPAGIESSPPTDY